MIPRGWHVSYNAFAAYHANVNHASALCDAMLTRYERRARPNFSYFMLGCSSIVTTLSRVYPYSYPLYAILSQNDTHAEFSLGFALPTFILVIIYTLIDLFFLIVTFYFSWVMIYVCSGHEVWDGKA